MIKHRRAGLSLLMVLLVLAVTPLWSTSAADMIVKNLQVTDIPNDDGSGLRISWTPLPKEARIQEYHIYRGISPDSLFLVSTIPVNPKTGVSSDVMYYYDSGWTQLISINSPAKLKKDKQPDQENSPLYLEVPHDMEILNSLQRATTMLYAMDIKPYYYQSKKIEKDGQVYAGVPWYYGSILGRLVPGNEYYYTVVATNEQRKYFMRADIVSGTPMPNEAAPVLDFYSKYLPEEGNIQFEWKHPVQSTAIRAYSVFIVEDSKLDAFLNGDYDKATQVAQVGASTTYASAKVSELSGYDFDSLEKYSFVIGGIYGGGITLSAPIKAMRSKLPEYFKNTSFYAGDAPDDKGDYNLIQWGKPSAFISATSFLGEKKDRMMIAYDYKINDLYKVDQIHFYFFEKGKDEPFYIHNEFYQDNKLVVTLPEGYNPANGIDVEIRFKAKSQKKNIEAIDDSYFLTQELKWDDFIKSLKPGDVFYNNVNLNKTFYTVFSKDKQSASYSVAKEVVAVERNFNDLSDYLKRDYAIVQGIDVENNLFLVDHNISYKYDKASDSVLSVSLFPGVDDETKASLKKEIDALLTQKGTETEPEAIATIDAQIAEMNAQLEQLNNPVLEKVNSIKGRRTRMNHIRRVREKELRSISYKLMISDGKGLFFQGKPLENVSGDLAYFYPRPNWIYKTRIGGLIAALIFGILVFVMVALARRGKALYLRPIAGIQEIDNAIGRATEMGSPILFVPGLSGISDVATLAGLQILNQVAKKAAEYDTPILVPCRDVIVLPIAQEIVKEAHYEAGRPDTFDPSSVFYMTGSQFAFVAGINGIMVREKVATNFYMGMFYAESLIMTETGNSIGAVQISGTDAVTQIPFFITTCDYTLMGEELYAAAAYLSKEPMMLGTLKAQDYFKFLILFFVVLGTLLSSFKITFLVNAFPDK